REFSCDFYRCEEWRMVSMENTLDRLVFFFSSRRRHTRSYGDWSSDVCSSDLAIHPAGQPLDRIAGDPGVELLAGADVVLEVVARPDVPAPAVGHALEHRRAFARARPLHRARGGPVDLDGVVAVDPQPGKTIGLGVL